MAAEGGSGAQLASALAALSSRLQEQGGALAQAPPSPPPSPLELKELMAAAEAGRSTAKAVEQATAATARVAGAIGGAKRALEAARRDAAQEKAAVAAATLAVDRFQTGVERRLSYNASARVSHVSYLLELYHKGTGLLCSH